MYKILVGIVAVVMIAAAIFVAERAVPATQAGPSDQGAGVGQAVIDALQGGGSVEVDVALRAPAAMAGNAAADVDALKAEVADVRGGVLSGLSPTDFQLGRQFSTIPGFTGTITRGGLNKLAAHPDVLRVDLPMLGSIHLDEVISVIDADQMHSSGFTGNGVTVAVLDTGIDTDHTDLANNLAGEECFNDCSNGTDRQSGPGAAEDDHGHGTHVSGIITSTGTISGRGVAPDAEIFAYRVLNTEGSGNLSYHVLPALDDIVANHPEIDIVNMSLGTSGLFPGDCDARTAFTINAAGAINTLRSRGVTTFASSGNNGSAGGMGIPACIANVISVGATYDADIGTYTGSCTDATTSVDQMTCFSNSSQTTDIFAPGCRTTSAGLSNGTSALCGTSMASPAAAACAALLLDENPSLTSAQIEVRLETSPVSVDGGSFGPFPRIDCSIPAPTPTPCPTGGCPTPTVTPTPSFRTIAPHRIAADITSAAVSGNTAILGVHNEDDAADIAGAAYIHRRDRGGVDNWGEDKKLIASDATAGFQFGFDVGISGDTAVVGMYDNAGGSVGAYVFQRDHGGPNNWGEVKKITSSDAANADLFGFSVAIGGDTIVVGAKYHNGAASQTGAAYVFQRDEGGADNWGEVKKLTASDAEQSDFFGHAVAVDGDAAVVGAIGEDDGGFAAGAAYVFQRDEGGAGNWGEVRKLTASDAAALDIFGVDVAVSGDNAIIGTSDAASPYFGKAYVFQRDQGGADNWGQAKKLSGPADAGGGFGNWVAVSGDIAVTSSHRHQITYPFEANEGGPNNWGAAYEELPQGGPLGISGSTVVVIAYAGDFAFVFELFPLPTRTPTPTLTPCPEGKVPANGGCGTPTPTPTKTSTPTPTITPTPTPTKQPEPGDTDGDGCSDQQENGADETLGGLRDYKNPWDFFDVLGPGAALPTDGVIDLPNDILGVILHFAPLGQAPYDVQFDRGPSSGPNPWNMTAPDGVIDLPNDILGVILQFQHNCV